MSVEITTAFVNHYTSNVQMLLQQRGSKLRGFVGSSSYTGNDAKAVEQIGAVSAQLRTDRHGDTPLISTPHDARWCSPADYHWADLIDDQDKLRMLIDPQSPYAKNGAMAMGRKIDDILITAALGTSRTGQLGTTSTVFDTTNQRIASGSAGMTVAKLREARKILLANQVDVEQDPLCIVVTARQLDDLLATTQVTSSDFNTVKTLVQGDIDTFLGFKFIHCERLGVNGSSERRVIAFAKSGLHLGIWNDITTRISERDDKAYSTQVYVKGTFGATRVEEGKVVEILCTES